MYEFHPYFTSDGSVGLYSKDFNDIFHSATGALTEAYEKFIYPVDFETLMSESEINVLDICYGIGYNSKSFLDFIFKNYFKKNFLKKINHAKTNIAPIYANNILSSKENKYNDKIYTNNKIESESLNCNAQIYSDNIFPKISITALDNDKILSFLSPFILSGKKKFNNTKLDFEYKNIDKYLKNHNFGSTSKISEIINFLIFDKISNNFDDFLNNDTILKLLKNPKYCDFFDSNIRGIYESYSNSKLSSKDVNAFYRFLHNIYYRHISKCYKNGLKTYQLCDINFDIKIDDARKSIMNDNKMYNLIFLDAFTPSKCPCLWSYDFFIELYNHLKSNGILLTYSSSASIRGAMIEAGFYIGNIYNKRENKFTGTVAVKNKSLIKYPLSEYDLGLLKTTAGIFYRDKNLTGQNEAIIEQRNSEVKNSNRLSSSKYKRQFGQ